MIILINKYMDKSVLAGCDLYMATSCDPYGLAPSWCPPVQAARALQELRLAILPSTLGREWL